MLRAGVFPDGWAYVPVAGKQTYIEKWSTRPLSKQECIDAYKLRTDYRGVGVVTGAHSGGLIALDIDGHDADERYQAVSGAEYEPFGEESSMSWTSGKAGRRQILYRLPQTVTDELGDVTTLILRLDGRWHLGHSDVERQASKAQGAPTGEDYQEVVLRFNKCQSVLPGSPHPDSGQRYRFLQYHGGKVAPAPSWVLDVLLGFRRPVRFFSDAMARALQLDDEHCGTIIPPKQIRGWFFKDDVQRLLMPRLEELVFNHPVFEKYGWKTRSGDNPQRMSGCPWHGGQSGTTFQYATESGCWDCKACGVHGDLLDFVHKIAVNDMYAGKPTGLDLEKYVAEIATKLGFSYPEDARATVTMTIDTPRVVMDERQFHEALIKIHDEELNPAIRIGRMAGLAAETGRRLTGQQCLAAMDEYRYYEDSRRQNQKVEWWQNVERMQFLVPNLLMKPTQVMLHAAGGLGKTSACMGLAKAVGRGETMRIRGIELPVKPGPVLWIQNDQNPAKLLRDCEDNGINPALDKWFIVKRGFQINHTHEFAEWIKAYRPSLVIVDSIGSCSTKMQVEEKDKAFASPFYYYAEKNGNPGDGGFPSTSIIWIHHDNANGDARGTRYLVAAVDEQWHLRTISEDEREALRGRGRAPSNCRMIQIKKSRLGRQGDLLVVERDENFSYSVWDYTPTERREDAGQGDPEPNTMALRIVKDHVLKARGDEGAGLVDRLSAKEVWERLVEEVTGQARRAPSSKTVKRWLDRWVDDGVLVMGAPLPVEGQRRPAPSYTLPLSRARALSMKNEVLSVHPADPLQENGSKKGHESTTEGDVLSSASPRPRQNMKGHSAESGQDVLSKIPVPESDLGDERTKDTPTSTYKGDGPQPEAPAELASEPLDADAAPQTGDVIAPAEPPVLVEYQETEGEWDAAFGLACPDEDTRLG